MSDNPFDSAVALLPPDVQAWYATNVIPHIEQRDDEDTASPFKTGQLRATSIAGDLAPPGWDPNYWHVVLYVPVLPDWSPGFLILHEIAHAWLGHRGSASQEEHDAHEDEANEQVRRWLDALGERNARA